MHFCNFKLDYEIFNNNVEISIPSVKYNELPKIYKCHKPDNIKEDITTDSIEIRWKKLPENTYYIELQIVDTTCTYGCNKICEFIHWHVKFPYKNTGIYENFFIIKNGKRIGIKKNGAKKIFKYMKKNDFNMKSYIPFCPPPNQKHSYVIKCILYNKDSDIFAKAMSNPFLI